MRFASITAVTAVLLAAGSASADLSYTYIEGFGYPFLQSPKLKVPIRDALGNKQRADIQIEGWGAGFDISYEIDQYWHFFARYNYSSSDTNQIEFVGSLGSDYTGKADVDQHAFAVGPGLHVAMGEKTDIVLELAFLYTRPRIVLDGSIEVSDLLGGGSIPIMSDRKEDQYGILGRAGIRREVADWFELFGYMSAQSVNLTTNNIFWELGAIYTPVDWIGLSASVDVGTDAQVGVRLGLRFYYDQFFKEPR